MILPTLNCRRWFAAAVIVSTLLLANTAEAQDNPPARIAYMSYLKGRVSFLRAGLDQWAGATLNFPVTTGDRVYTDKDGRAELEAGFSTVRLADQTDLTVTNLNDQILQLGLEQGTARLAVNQLPSGGTVEVDTPNGALTAEAAVNFRVDVDPNGSGTRVVVNSGSLQISGGGFSQVVEAGEAVRLTGQDPIQSESVPFPSPDRFDQWCEERDRRHASSESRKYVSPSTPGYAELDGYGRWTEVADYGPIWYPAVPVGWVPYRLGHWAWIDPWGWTWVDDEPWGFCTFHYGRWVQIGVAWGWLPGPVIPLPVYAPAFVAFLGGPGFSIGIGVDLVGWFPLGPGEPFFPWYHYRGEYFREVNITNIRNVTNVTNITNITNINNVHYAYRTVATTAVPAKAFSSGEPVARQVVHVDPQRLAKAAVLPHPPTNPTLRAATPGKPVTAPPVRSRPLAARASSGSPTPISPERQSSSSNRNAPPVTHQLANRAPLPPEARPHNVPQRPEPPRLITRSAPPPPEVPFEDRRQAMEEHPGRPLEPPQVGDLRSGRSVGPMRDSEFPPHPAPIVREAPRAEPPPPKQHPHR
jgi:hypothetical protein